MSSGEYQLRKSLFAMNVFTITDESKAIFSLINNLCVQIVLINRLEINFDNQFNHLYPILNETYS